MHLLAELVDNALRYSPPAEPVHVRAVYTTSGGVLVEVDDSGLGMTDSDLRIANMRLTAGGEVSPDSARHMGLFVAGRLARQHDMTVRLLGSANGVGTTAQLYLPPELLDGGAAGPGVHPSATGGFSARPEPEPSPSPRHAAGLQCVPPWASGRPGARRRRRAGHSRGGRIRLRGGRFRRCLGDAAAAA